MRFAGAKLTRFLINPQIAEFLEDCDSRAPQGTERGLRVSQAELNILCERVRATENAPRGPLRLLEYRHCEPYR